MILKPETNHRVWNEFIRRIGLNNCNGDLVYSRFCLEGLATEGHDIDIKETIAWLRDSFDCDCEVWNWDYKNVRLSKSAGPS